MNLDNYIAANRKLPPSIVSVLTPFFTKPFLGTYWNGKNWNPAMAKVILKDRIAKLATLGRGLPVSTWVSRDTIRFVKTYLNRPGIDQETQVNLDLTTPSGMATVAEEVYHAYEWQTRGFSYQFGCVMNTLFGWIGRRFHQSSGEKRAADFKRRVSHRLVENPDQLIQFYQCRPPGYE